MKRNNLFIWIAALLLVSSAYALKNPVAMYCQALGYTYEDKFNENGDEVGICDFPGNAGNLDCNAGDFMNGKCGAQYSYCAKMGYQQKNGTNGAECGSADLLAECLLCVLPNGTTAEVTSLMNLDLTEGVCGDGSCVIGENHENCPQDCPATTTTMEETSTTEEIPTTLEEITTLPIATTPSTEVTTQPQETTTIPEETTQPPESTTMPETTTTTVPGSPETGGGLMDYLAYIILIVILLAALFIIKKKRDEKKIAKEKEEFEKWKQEKERAGGTV